ncbi:MAG: hypothetical protein U0237_13030 [Thermoleophilia bacterium]
MDTYDRPVRGADVVAACAAFPGRSGLRDAVAARLDPAAVFADLEELERACPPEAIGVTPGAYATLFAPLFGEFE